MNLVIHILKKIRGKAMRLLPLVCVLLLCGCNCKTFQTYLDNGLSVNNKCLICRLFKTLTDAANDAANASWNAFAEELALVVMYATAIYIAFYTLKLVGSFGKQEVADYMSNDKTGLLFLAFKMAIIMSLLKSDFFVDSIISPLLESGLKIGQQLGSDRATINWSAGSGGGWNALFSMINDAVKAYNDQVYETVAIGQAMICRSTQGFIFGWYWLMLCYGLLYFIFGWFLLATVSFYLADILLALTFGAVMLPFGVAFAISNQTSQYSNKIWQIFLNVFFNFVMLGLVLGLSVELVELGMGKMNEDNAPDMGTNGFLGNIATMLDNDQVKEVSEILWSSGSLLLTIVCFCLLTNLVMTIKDLASSVSDAAGVTNAASKAGVAATKDFVEDAKYASEYAGRNVAHMAKYGGHVVSRVTRMDKASDYVNDKLTDFRGWATGTGKKGYKAWWR
ncbi:MAG: type IV secretion system protein [Alphaproteobacteria bacterium]|nr:type IV secretion system protein [Alphaproteobacteria bacterium]